MIFLQSYLCQSRERSYLINEHRVNHFPFYFCSLASLLFSSFYFGSSETSVLFVIESPLPIIIFKMRLKLLSFARIFAMGSNLVSSIFSATWFFALFLRWINCLILAHLKVYLIGQSLIVLSSTTALFMMSFPVRREVYLLFSSLDWLDFG